MTFSPGSLVMTAPKLAQDRRAGKRLLMIAADSRPAPPWSHSRRSASALDRAGFAHRKKVSDDESGVVDEIAASDLDRKAPDRANMAPPVPAPVQRDRPQRSGRVRPCQRDAADV